MWCIVKTETLVIHFDKLKDHLDGLETLDPERTWSPLDFMRSTVQYNLSNLLTGEKRDAGMIEIDHDNRVVTILGDPIEWTVKLSPMFNDLPYEEKLYKMFADAREYADYIGKSDEFFEKIR